MSNYYRVDKANDEKDDTLITQKDVVAALEDISEAAPELMEFVLTCYPPELMIHMSPELRKLIDDAHVQSDKKDNN